MNMRLIGAPKMSDLNPDYVDARSVFTHVSFPGESLFSQNCKCASCEDLHCRTDTWTDWRHLLQTRLLSELPLQPGCKDDQRRVTFFSFGCFCICMYVYRSIPSDLFNGFASIHFRSLRVLPALHSPTLLPSHHPVHPFLLHFA